MKILHLTLKKKWFGMILSGVKKEEYREIKPYWNKRLLNKKFDRIELANGYGKNVPRFQIELESITKGFGKSEWGGDPGQEVYVLKLGKIIK